MNQILLITPLVVPLVTAVLCLGLRRWPRGQAALAWAGSAVTLAMALALLRAVWRDGVLAVAVGNWPAPFGIVLVADLLAAVMTAVSALVALVIVIYAQADTEIWRRRGFFLPLQQFLMMGVYGAFLTGDLFNLYVWFEVMLISSFVLMVLGGGQARLEGSLKYVLLNVLASLLFLCGLGILYGKLGSLNMADIALMLRETSQPTLLLSTAMLFLVAFGIKAGIFPLFFWLPASYHTCSYAVSALFAGLLTKVGVYALIRTFTLVFRPDPVLFDHLLPWLAGATMVTGVLGAAAQFEMRRILSFHIISQIGYMLMGLVLQTPLALAGTIFYLVHHILVKTNLFLVSGWVAARCGSCDLKRIGGLYQAAPLGALLFLVPALSLGGIPPLSGFWAKLILIRAALEAQAYGLAAVALLVGILTLYSMTKIWAEAFWKHPPEPGPARESEGPVVRWTMWLPIGVLGILTLAIGLYGQPLFVLSLKAAEQVLSPDAYMAALPTQGL